MLRKTIVLALLLTALTGCDWFSSDSDKADLEPVICHFGPPVTAVVTPTKAGCDTSSCRAQFFVDPSGVRRLWTFPLGIPRQWLDPTVEVTWDRPASFPASFIYSIKVCNCTGDLDTTDTSCRTFNGSLTFDSATDKGVAASQMAALRIEVGAGIEALRDLDLDAAQGILEASAARAELTGSWHFAAAMARARTHPDVRRLARDASDAEGSDYLRAIAMPHPGDDMRRLVVRRQSDLARKYDQVGALADYMSEAAGGSCWWAACAGDHREQAASYPWVDPCKGT